MRRSLWVWLVYLIIGLAGLGLRVQPAVAAERVVVLELSNPAGLQPQEAAYLTDLVRGVVGELPSSTYLVLTRENLLELLPPGTELAGCVGKCEVETGRKVGADHVLSGEVVRFGDELRVSLRMHDTRSGRLEGMETASASRMAELEGPLRFAARRLVRRLPGPVVSEAEAPLVTAGFGPGVEIPPEPVPPPRFLPSAEGISDVGLLEKIQAVRRAENSTPVMPVRAALAWKDLADHPPPNPLNATAAPRAEEWRQVAEATRTRDALLVQVRQRRAEDEKKLNRLLALDRDVVPLRQKAAYVEEYNRAWERYGPYRVPMPVTVYPPAPAPAPAPAESRPLIGAGVDWPPIVVMSAGGVMVAAGLLATAVGNFQSDDFDLKNCRRHQDDAEIFRCTDAEFEIAREEAVAGDDTISAGWTTIGIGAAVAVGGGLWYVTRHSGTTVGATAGPGGVTVYGAF